jgi:putative endonuclease
MNTTESGRKAEQAARSYLEMRGFTIIELNYRRPRCEIDIVARKDNAVHLVEVKYRKNDDQGGGFEAITATKLRQMRYAAETWTVDNKWTGEVLLSAIEVAGREYSILSFVEGVI